MTAHPVARYIPLLIAGDEQELRDLFRDPPRINDPHVGWVQESRFDQFVENSHKGLLEQSASVEHVTTTATSSGATEECGDLSGMPEQFAPAGELREPGGSLQVHRGATELRRFFTVLFSNGGGLGLEHCTIANEGASCALEYIVTSWGRSPVTHQAAAAVYERADTGLLAGVRMYDDIEHPFQRN